MSDNNVTPTAAAPAQASDASAPSSDSADQSTENISSEQAAPEVKESQIDADPSLNAQEKKELKKRLKLKVDGQEFEEEFDANDDEYLTRQLQLAKAAQKRMQETAQIKKDVSEFLKALNDSPEEALSQIGIDPEKFVNEYVNRKLEEQAKSPEVLAQEKMAKELDKLKKELELKENAARESEMARMKEQYERELESDITSAISSQKDLPKSPYVVKRIADMMMLAINNGHENVKASDVMPLVQKQIKSELQQMFEAMPEEILEKVVGKKNFERVRKKRVSQKIENAKQIKDTGVAIEKKAENEAKEKAEKKAKLAKDFFKNL